MNIKLLFTAGIGGIVGTFLSILFAPHFWLLGTLTGGLFGYIALDFKIAWRISVEFVRSDWTKTKEECGVARRHYVALTLLFLYFLTFCVLFFSASYNEFVMSDGFLESAEVVASNIILSTFCTILWCILHVMIWGVGDRSFAQEEGSVPDDETFSGMFVCTMRGIKVISTWCLERLGEMAVVCVSIGLAVGTFLRKLPFRILRAIYTDRRLLCGTSCFIGGLAGYMLSVYGAAEGVTELLFCVMCGGAIAAGVAYMLHKAYATKMKQASA